MSELVPELLAKRRDRAIAIILSVKERECDGYLPPAQRAKLRKVILDQLNDFCDLANDLSRSLASEEVVVNELYLERLAALHDDVTELRKLVTTKVG